jgi:hypothetical protein
VGVILTLIGLQASGSSTLHIYTQKMHSRTQNKQYIKQHKNIELKNNRTTQKYRTTEK